MLQRRRLRVSTHFGTITGADFGKGGTVPDRAGCFGSIGMPKTSTAVS
jgi:hypothetical protein